MMRGRSLAALAIVLVGLLSAWGVSSLERVEVDVPATLRGQAAIDPFYGAVKVMRELGASATSDRVLSLPAKDGVLLLSGWRWGLNAERAARVQRWVEGGGRLVVDESILVDAAFQDWSGLKPTSWTSLKGELRPRGGGCRPVVPVATAPVEGQVPYSLCTPMTFAGIASARPAEWALGDARGYQLVRVRLGTGSVTAINGTVFTWREVLAGGHAAMLVAATRLRSGDAVHFLSESEYPSIVALAWRSGAPVILLVLLAVAAWLWRQSLRFGPMVVPGTAARRSLEEQIRGTGEFTTRYGAGRPLLAAALRALEEQAARRVPGYTRLNGDARLQALSQTTGVATGALAEAMVSGGAGTSTASALTTLETARRALLTRTQKD